jgi:beta-galactosidase/beta-glucuronidase
MLTRWGAAIRADRPAEERAKVLDDYPRPQLVRPDWQNLNGTWQYAITPLRKLMPSTWDGEILVPFCVESPLSGVERSVAADERLWYRRTFSLQDANQRTLLHFGAVDYQCAVWVNGGLAASHIGGSDPFTVDITALVDQKDNELVVAVTDPTSSADQPRGKQHLKPQGIWYTPVTGIWQTVWLEQVPKAQHIDALQITPTPECDAVTVSAFLYRPTRDPTLAIRITVRRGEEVINTMVGRPDRTVRVPVPHPKLWSPDEPILYDVDVTLLRIDSPLPQANDRQRPAQLVRDVPVRGTTEAALYAAVDVTTGVVLDEVSSYFGLRHIEVGLHPDTGQPTVLLNGEPVFHLGPLDQGWWPDGLLTAPADEAMVYELEYLKAAGFNTLRKHIKVEPARYYYHCDRLGILVWQDMPSGFVPAQFVAPNDEGDGLRNPRAVQRYELELQRLIHCLSHHPSIVIWVLHNEGWGQFDTHRLTERIRSLDPTRLVNSASGWLDVGAGDLIDRHDYQPEPAPPEGDGRRALVMGEYGGVGWPIENHLWNPAMRNWGYQTFHNEEDVKAAYVLATEAIIAMHRDAGVCGAIYTQTTDVEGEINGLLTYDRDFQKLTPAWLAETHAPLVRQP